MNLGSALTKVFGSRNDRLLKRYWKIVDQINDREADVQPMTDEQLRARTAELRQGITARKLRTMDVLPEAMAIIRESMGRHIGIREIFNPDQHFDPDRFSDANLELYDSVQRQMIQTGETWQQVKIPHGLYAAVREMYPESRPPFRARPFDVQLIGGVVLYEGKIAEMKTGEGKTFVGPLAFFLRAIEGNHCHVVTVNDYLVRRDSMWVKPAFDNLGITIGYIQNTMDPGGAARRNAYRCDITYGTSSEFGFDYLRDNMKERADLQVQGRLDFAIVDEIDSILIDEARTPLIISGPAHQEAPKYADADRVARKILDLHRPFEQAERHLDNIKRAIKAAEGDIDKAPNKEAKGKAQQHLAALQQQEAAAEEQLAGQVAYYEKELDRKSVHLTHEGIAAAQEEAGVGSFYVGDNMEWPHLMEQALRAHVVYERDKDYVVERGDRTGQMEVVIVDEFTGRKMTGRQWSDGLHQAVEAKEKVQIKQETQTMATITLQNFYKLYKAISGMTGTAQTEAEEFAKMYKLEVVSIPTNRPVLRDDHNDLVFRTPDEKWKALIDEIKAFSDAGRPVLVGTTSVEKSEMLSALLSRTYGIEHEVLNAKQHEREAHIVENAGKVVTNKHGELVGTVTIATNMAGRGTDIKPAVESFFDVVEVKKIDKYDAKYTLKQRKTGKIIEVSSDEEGSHVWQLRPDAKVVGGLHVIGTERHTARRIDNQLRGRSGRQGDPGSSRFYVSLKDDLMAMFMNDWTIKVLGFLGMKEGEAIEDKRISKGIEKAQKKVEERNFLARKNLLEYDEVMDHQRGQFYSMRQQVLEGRNIDQVIWGMIGESIEDAVEKYIVNDYPADVMAEWARQEFDILIEPEGFKGLRRVEDVEDYIRAQAKTEVETNLVAQLAEFMGEDQNDAAQWHAKDLASFAMSRYGVSLTQSRIRQMTDVELTETMKAAAFDRIDKKDLSPLTRFLDPLFATRALQDWTREKFDIEVPTEDILADQQRRMYRPAESIIELIDENARDEYRRREIEYPVDHVLSALFGQDPAAVALNPQAAEYLVQWIKSRYARDWTIQDIVEKPVRDLREKLVALQEEFYDDEVLDRMTDELLGEGNPAEVAKRFNERFLHRTEARHFDPAEQRTVGKDRTVQDQTTVRDLLRARVVNIYRAELTQLEQYVLINIIDQSWKDHLYGMDVLKGGIGLQAFAEKDPRVAYKREGFRLFNEMMIGVRDKVTNLIFQVRMGNASEARNAYGETTTNAPGEEASPRPAARVAKKKDRGAKVKKRR